MKFVKLLVFLALAKIKLAANERCRVGRHRQTFLHLLRGQGRELRQKCEAPFTNCLAHLTIAHIGGKEEWGRSRELLALKKQRRPGTEQEQRSHRAITAGRALKSQAFA